MYVINVCTAVVYVVYYYWLDFCKGAPLYNIQNIERALAAAYDESRTTRVLRHIENAIESFQIAIESFQIAIESFKWQ